MSLNLCMWIFTNVLFVSYFIIPIKGVTISTKLGAIKGTTLTSRNGTKYIAFYAIPYAKPPVGKLRFEAPRKPDMWKGTRDATQQRDGCLQTHWTDGVTGEEDCLYLNVFTPQESGTDTTTPRLPTIVFIHGGGMSGKPSDTNPKYFMDHPIVYVDLQFRLNVMGVLSAADDILPGNYNMKDQVAALEWIQQNIVEFGGDPNQVTLMGNSTGGAQVYLHMHSPLSKGLFHRVITQSGSGLSRWAVSTVTKTRQNARKFSKMCGCVFKPTSALVECLRKIPAEQLVLSHDKFKDKFPLQKPFAVVIENKSSNDAFLTENPWLQDTISPVPWITGINSGEGIYKATKLLLDPQNLREFDNNYKQLFPTIFSYEYLNDEMASETSEKLRKLYFRDDPVDKEPQKLVDLYGDSYFSFDVIEAAKRHNGNVYFYLYDHRGVHSFSKFSGTYENVHKGVAHADELLSLFVHRQFPEVTEGPDLKVSERMVKFWVNFVQKGDPNGEEIIWQPIQSYEFEYLHIKTEVDVMEKNLWAERYNIWKDLPIFSVYDIISNFNEEKMQKQVLVPRDMVATG